MSMRVSWDGREITRQPWRAMAVTFGIVAGLGGMILALVVLILIPLSLPLHGLVYAFNGRGFWDRATGSYKVPPWACLLIVAGILALIFL